MALWQSVSGLQFSAMIMMSWTLRTDRCLRIPADVTYRGSEWTHQPQARIFSVVNPAWLHVVEPTTTEDDPHRNLTQISGDIWCKNQRYWANMQWLTPDDGFSCFYAHECDWWMDKYIPTIFTPRAYNATCIHECKRQKNCSGCSSTTCNHAGWPLRKYKYTTVWRLLNLSYIKQTGFYIEGVTIKNPSGKILFVHNWGRF